MNRQQTEAWRTVLYELHGALSKIAAMPIEGDEWEGRDKFREARAIARKALDLPICEEGDPS